LVLGIGSSFGLQLIEVPPPQTLGLRYGASVPARPVVPLVAADQKDADPAGVEGEQHPDGANAQLLEVGNRGAGQGVDPGTPEARASLGQKLHRGADVVLGLLVQLEEPLLVLRGDLDLPHRAAP
jgi:hypothetical protein